MSTLTRVIRTMLVIGIGGVAGLVLAADPATYSIEIPAQDLATALLKFATVTHRQIAFDHKLVEGLESTALSGTYTVSEGLRALIGKSPLVVSATASDVLTVTPAPAAPPPKALASTSASPSQAREEVIVSAQRSARRAELMPKIRSFVSAIADTKDGVEGGLPRWQKPICLLVAGLSRQEGEFILERVSEVARSAGVPLASEHCDANLYILVTSQPEELLQGMRKRNRIYTFGADAYPAVVEEFIDTPRPVRVWYNTNMFDAWGLPPKGAAPDSVENYPAITRADVSRILSNVVYTFAHVFVIVDRARLQGVTRGQLADYVAMVSLAQIKPATHPGDAQTILRLFDGTPRAAPAGMSEWDKVFLKSLYGTEPRLISQRPTIARQMVDEIVP